MKLGIIIYSTDAEAVWNAFRLGVFARKQGDQVSVFLLAKGVECEGLETPVFRVATRCGSSSRPAAGSSPAALA